MNNGNYFETKDIYLASTLIAIGNTRYTLDKRGKIFYFVFDKRQNQEKIDFEVDEYWAKNTLVDPMVLFSTFKELKGRIFDEIGGNTNVNT